ncbi:MAG: hypothetical protein R3C10_01940 [Pirellulales bacterium]
MPLAADGPSQATLTLRSADAPASSNPQNPTAECPAEQGATLRLTGAGWRCEHCGTDRADPTRRVGSRSRRDVQQGTRCRPAAGHRHRIQPATGPHAPTAVDHHRQRHRRGHAHPGPLSRPPHRTARQRPWRVVRWFICHQRARHGRRRGQRRYCAVHETTVSDADEMHREDRRAFTYRRAQR